MTSTKRASLSGLAAKKPGEAEPAPIPPKSAQKGLYKALSIRLVPTVWQQLKMLSVEKETTMHALLLEALNDLFIKYGKKPIA